MSGLLKEVVYPLLGCLKLSILNYIRKTVLLTGPLRQDVTILVIFLQRIIEAVDEVSDDEDDQEKSDDEEYSVGDIDFESEEEEARSGTETFRLKF